MYSMRDKSALQELIESDEFANRLNIDRKTYGLVFDKRTFDKEKINRTNLVFVWAQKEYTNLVELKKVKANVLLPFWFYKNVLLMSYLGTKSSPARQIKDVSTDMALLYKNLKKQMYIMYNKAGIVHADLSEYNILYYRKKPYIIDVGQSVSIKHPMAEVFLQRDIKNVVTFFSHKGVQCNEQELYNYLKGDKND